MTRAEIETGGFRTPSAKVVEVCTSPGSPQQPRFRVACTPDQNSGAPVNWRKVEEHRAAQSVKNR